MTKNTYLQRLLEHLANYRATVLGVEAGEWGRPPRTYGHILPRDRAALNIVEPLRSRFAEAQAIKQWKLHRYFHHLSSSQALAFNLFLPLFPAVPLNFVATRRTLGLLNASAHVDFEVELKGGDGTNIDVLIEEPSSRRTIIEVKLTEASFGRAANDEQHLTKLRTVYAPLLRDRLDETLLEPKAFFREYQLFRQLAQLRPNTDDRVVLLLPRARHRLWDHALKWSTQPQLGALGSRVQVVAIEDIIEALGSDTKSTGSDVQAAQGICAKYLPAA